LTRAKKRSLARRVLCSQFGEYIDNTETDQTLQRLAEVKETHVLHAINGHPKEWLSDDQKHAILRWWNSDARTDRIVASLRRRSAESWGMPKVSRIKHEAVPSCGSYEIRFPDGRPSRFVYWDDLAGRRMRPEMVDSAVTERVAKIFARAEQRRLDLNRQRLG